MANLELPPPSDRYPVVKEGEQSWAEIPYTWQKWFRDINMLLSPLTTGGSMLWSAVSKVGSNLTDIVTRNHADLQNINTASYTHLTATNHTDLTDAGDSALHYHATDRDLANATGQLSLDHLASMKAYAARHG